MNKIVDVTVLVLVFLFLLSTASAQQPASPPLYTFHPSIGTIIFVVLFALLFIGYFFLYFRLYPNSYSSDAFNAATSLRFRNPGLDANTVASFPVFRYSEVKELKIGKNAIECAICLNEFENDETLRLIPNCDHVFHPDCIDAWLALHVTCPVCRADLVSKPKKPEMVPLTSESVSVVSPVMIVPQDDGNPEHGHVYTRALDQGPSAEAQEQSNGRQTRLFKEFPSFMQRRDLTLAQSRLGQRLPRSHSTGHSLELVPFGENTERFTLRFPDHLRKEVMTRALIRTAILNEGSSRRNRRGGEGGSSRGARSHKILDRAVMSDSWVITIPIFTSGKLPASDGEGSIGKGKATGVKLPSFKCLESTTSGNVDSLGSGRSTV